MERVRHFTLSSGTLPRLLLLHALGWLPFRLVKKHKSAFGFHRLCLTGILHSLGKTKIVILQVEKWLKRAFLPGMRTFKPAAVAIAITSPGAYMAKPDDYWLYRIADHKV